MMIHLIIHTHYSPLHKLPLYVKNISIATAISNIVPVVTWYWINTKFCSITQHYPLYTFYTYSLSFASSLHPCVHLNNSAHNQATL